MKGSDLLKEYPHLYLKNNDIIDLFVEKQKGRSPLTILLRSIKNKLYHVPEEKGMEDYKIKFDKKDAINTIKMLKNDKKFMKDWIIKNKDKYQDCKDLINLNPEDFYEKYKT